MALAGTVRSPLMELAYSDRGRGQPVLFIAGRGAVGRTWQLHQVPAFLGAGYRVITFDNRGVGATGDLDGFSLATMVDDTIVVIEALGAAPVNIVSTSLGSLIAQELMLVRPDLVNRSALMATRGRHDRARRFLRDTDEELADLSLPPKLDAKIRLLEGLSPKTLNDDEAVQEWIHLFTMWPTKSTPGLRAQYKVTADEGRLAAYRNITKPVLVVGFADDLVSPPHLGAEVAAALPNGTYLEIADAGHLGFLERPQEVNSAILQFFAETG